jgi:hypothetical protein
MMRPLLKLKPSNTRLFSKFAVQADEQIFKQPLEDFDFDSTLFAKPAFAKVDTMHQSLNCNPPLKERLRNENDMRLA